MTDPRALDEAIVAAKQCNADDTAVQAARLAAEDAERVAEATKKALGK
jgi:hypothetical protein